MEPITRARKLHADMLRQGGTCLVIINREYRMELIPFERLVGVYTTDVAPEQIVEDFESAFNAMLTHGRGA